MANWDKIYKAFNKKGKDWENISNGVMPRCFVEDISPIFLEFIEKTKFKNKYVFDIGCGKGNYLLFLSSLGWQTDGIDFSETSVKMTRDLLGDNTDDIRQADMFDMEITPNKYDLVISIRTINHGFKKDLSKLINQIYESLLDGGYAFITIPDKKCLQTWQTFQKHKKLDENTVIPLIGPEIDIPHSFYDKYEIEEMFGKFSKLDMKKDESGQWMVIARK